jgi:uroporphyrinogen III methyltransferase/synthase
MNRAGSLFSKLITLSGELPPGTVSLVGAGPGDSTLVSVRGAVRLGQADVVLHDKLIGPELLEIVRPGAQRIFVGKWRGTHAWKQEDINESLVQHARAGLRVVRLKGGDPFVFGRGGEECEHLARAGVPFEVVPGITAAFGAPSAAGIPLTHRGMSRSFALVTGHAEPPDASAIDFEALARVETIAIYMGVKNLAANCQGLMDAGMNPRTPAAVIEDGTRPTQRTIVGTLQTIANRVEGQDLRPPAMVLIGEVVRMREHIEWFERRPLHGQVIAVTRMRDQSEGLSGQLAALGAEVIEAPTIELGALEDYGAVDAALRRLPEYQWLVVTSANGVDAVFARLARLGLDARALGGLEVAAVGSATAARFGEHGIRPDLVPSEAVGEALAESLISRSVRGRRVLMLRAEVARRTINQALQGAGAIVDDLAIYRTVCPRELPEVFLSRLERNEIDWITLTSPSSFNNLLTLLGPDRAGCLYNVKLASIGPVTTQAIRDRGYLESVEADPHDAGGLVAALCRPSGEG